ncbi:hypothetical protein JB92DRAFT_810809 [Gautieria morchelliformis]|nr:hypothetical protein JB92DRAFT_810809 [Gautieria morchelliformis]
MQRKGDRRLCILLSGTWRLISCVQPSIAALFCSRGTYSWSNPNLYGSRAHRHFSQSHSPRKTPYAPVNGRFWVTSRLQTPGLRDSLPIDITKNNSSISLQYSTPGHIPVSFPVLISITPHPLPGLWCRQGSSH